MKDEGEPMGMEPTGMRRHRLPGRQPGGANERAARESIERHRRAAHKGERAGANESIKRARAAVTCTVAEWPTIAPF
jgi:hypothetical protein